MARMMPFSSATGMNILEGMTMEPSRIHRTSASQPMILPSRVHDGLVVQRELSLDHGFPHFPLEEPLLGRPGLERGVVDDEAVPPGFLGEVHGDLGVLDRGLDGHAVVGQDRDADARVELDALSAPVLIELDGHPTADNKPLGDQGRVQRLLDRVEEARRIYRRSTGRPCPSRAG